MRFWRQQAELVGWVGVGASLVVLLSGDRLGLTSRWEEAPTPLRRDVVAADGSGTRHLRRRRLPQDAPLSCSWRARRRWSVPAAGGRQAQRLLLPADDAWARRWRTMWTCDHHSGSRGHFLDGSLGIYRGAPLAAARVQRVSVFHLPRTAGCPVL